MHRIPLLHRPLQTSTQAIVLIMGIIVFSETAAGSCGSYVHRRNVNSDLPKTMQTAPQADENSPADRKSHRQQTPAEPCSGPGCRRLPDSQSLPLATTDSVGPSHKLSAVVEPEASPVSGTERRLPNLSDGLADRGFPPLIDVPPECA
jgi:hypothetical protein